MEEKVAVLVRGAGRPVTVTRDRDFDQVEHLESHRSQLPKCPGFASRICAC